jgi:hypothetical protein
MPSNRMPSATGVRIAGDRYQWGHVWRLCLQLLYEQRSRSAITPIVAVGVEVSGAGNVDDVVAYREAPPHQYSQVKYAVDGRTPVSLEYLRDEGILRRMVDARLRLRGDSRIEVRLVTNRLVDPNDLLLADKDGRDGRLLPRAGQDGPASARGVARTAWADAAGTDVGGLLDFLSEFHLEAAFTVELLDRELGLLMAACGLDSSAASIDLGISWIEHQVIDGVRKLELTDIQDAVNGMGFQKSDPWTTVSISTVKPDSFSSAATVSVDWVERMSGDDEWTRVVPAPPNTWDQLALEIEGAATVVPPSSKVLITGWMRQATGFFAGALFRRVRGFEVGVYQRDQLWTGAEPTRPGSATMTRPGFESQGNDLAVVVNVSADGTSAVIDWMRTTELPVDRVIAFSPAAGIGARSMVDATSASSFAQELRDRVRVEVGASNVHLFLIGPLGLAVLLGHHWNRVAMTWVYEHLGPAGYVEAFRVSA